MALTQSAWSVETVNGHLVCTCDVTATTSENDAYTLKTPAELDGSKPWTLFANTEGATLDGSALPVDIYAGYSDDFVMSGDAGTVGATDGALLIADAIADVKASVGTYSYDPANTAAAGPAPYFAFNLDGASALNAATCRFVVVQ